MQATFVLFLISIVESRRQSQINLPMPLAQPSFEGHSESVDFGHVYRNNIRKNPRGDFPELEFSKPKKEYPKEAPREEGLLFLSPRDEIQHEKSMNKSKVGGINKHHLVPFDYSKILEENIARHLVGALPSRHTYYKKQPATTKNSARQEEQRTKSELERRQEEDGEMSDIYNYFEQNKFLIKPNNSQKTWTTCDEFKRKSVFHPDDVINTKWLPFYIWSERQFDTAVIHTLSYPTRKTVQHYKINYGPYIDRKINWREPKLLLKERREILLIAGDRRGLFFGIPDQSLGSSLKSLNISLPVIPLRMKIYDPYLVMMYCDEYYATIMAELNTDPQTESDKITEAESLKFKGKGRPVSRNEGEERRFHDLMKKRRKEQQSNKFINTDELIGAVKRKLKQ